MQEPVKTIPEPPYEGAAEKRQPEIRTYIRVRDQGLKEPEGKMKVEPCMTERTDAPLK